MATCYYCGKNECRCHVGEAGGEIGEITRLTREVARLTSALSAAERERDEALKKANVRVTTPEVYGYELGYADAKAESAAELERTREVVEAARRLVADLVRAGNNRAGKGPEGRITGADTLPLQALLGISLTLREPFGALRTDKEGADGP